MAVKRRRKLKQVIAAGSSPQRLVLRARIVLAARDEGGPTPRSPPNWAARPRPCAGGGAGSRCAGSRGFSTGHRRAGRLAVVAAATAAPPAGQSEWSHRTLAAYLGERGLAVSPATVGRVLAEAEVRPHRSGAGSTGPTARGSGSQAGAVCRLYLDGPTPGTLLRSVDEKTGIQAKTRKYPQIPARARRPGRDACREFEYVRHGTVSIAAAMDTATGQVVVQRIGRNNSLAG
jgi:hypothetical protein